MTLRAVTKIGRNERCPCGSGKKYKKCCLAYKQARTEPEAYDKRNTNWRSMQKALNAKRDKQKKKRRKRCPLLTRPGTASQTSYMGRASSSPP